MKLRILHKCECEHDAHFEKNKRTPNGNPGHNYQSEYFENYMRTVRTPYGSFLVCKDCAEDCLHRYTI